MATFTYKELFGHAGTIWKRAVELWESFLQTSGTTWAHEMTTTDGFPAVKITLVKLPDTNIYYLIDYGRGQFEAYKPDEMVAKPGWNTTPKQLFPSYPAGNTRTVWTSTLLALRKAFFISWTNAFSTAYTGGAYNLDLISGIVEIQTLHFRYKCTLGVDYTTISVAIPTATMYYPGNANVAQGTPTPNIPVVGGGGAVEIDLSALVQAVQDVAHREVQTSLNNGAVSVLGYAGEVIVP